MPKKTPKTRANALRKSGKVTARRPPREASSERRASVRGVSGDEMRRLIDAAREEYVANGGKPMDTEELLHYMGRR